MSGNSMSSNITNVTLGERTTTSQATLTLPRTTTAKAPQLPPTLAVLTTTLPAATVATLTTTAGDFGIPVFSRAIVYIAASSICAGLTLLVVFVLLIKVFFFPERYTVTSRSSASSIDNRPPAPIPIHYHPHDSRYDIYQASKREGDRNSDVYAKPEIYSTYINPSFYEDVYERWRRQESGNYSSAEIVYVSPYQLSKPPEQDGTEESNSAGGRDYSDIRWSSVSLQTHDGHDYGGFGKVSSPEINDTIEYLEPENVAIESNGENSNRQNPDYENSDCESNIT